MEVNSREYVTVLAFGFVRSNVLSLSIDHIATLIIPYLIHTFPVSFLLNKDMIIFQPCSNFKNKKNQSVTTFTQHSIYQSGIFHFKHSRSHRGDKYTRGDNTFGTVALTPFISQMFVGHDNKSKIIFDFKWIKSGCKQYPHGGYYFQCGLLQIPKKAIIVSDDLLKNDDDDNSNNSGIKSLFNSTDVLAQGNYYNKYFNWRNMTGFIDYFVKGSGNLTQIVLGQLDKILQFAQFGNTNNLPTPFFLSFYMIDPDHSYSCFFNGDMEISDVDKYDKDTCWKVGDNFEMCIDYDCNAYVSDVNDDKKDCNINVNTNNNNGDKDNVDNINKTDNNNDKMDNMYTNTENDHNGWLYFMKNGKLMGEKKSEKVGSQWFNHGKIKLDFKDNFYLVIFSNPIATKSEVGFVFQVSQRLE